MDERHSMDEMRIEEISLSDNSPQKPQQKEVKKSIQAKDLWEMFKAALPKTKKDIIKLVVIILIIAALMGGIYALVKSGAMVAFLHWVESIGPWGPVVIAISIILASFPVVFVFAILELASGFLFGAILGIPLVLVSGTLGAMLSFTIFRKFFRKIVEKRTNQNILFKKVTLTSIINLFFRPNNFHLNSV